jgi:hypothetical protein
MHPHPSPEAIRAPRFRRQRTHSIYLCFSCANPPSPLPTHTARSATGPGSTTIHRTLSSDFDLHSQTPLLSRNGSRHSRKRTHSAKCYSVTMTLSVSYPRNLSGFGASLGQVTRRTS